jgi:hypothetical protein
MIPIPIGLILDAIVAWATTAILDMLTELISIISHALLQSPDMTGLPQVQALAGRATWIVDSAYILTFTAAGVLTIVSGAAERPRYTAKDLAPRLVVGFIAAHFATLICTQAIELANALTNALSADGYDIVNGFATIKDDVEKGALNPPAAMLFLAIVIIIVILVATTVISVLTRFANLLILTAVAPLALACHATPHTDPIAKLWWRSYGGVLAIPVLQVLTLQAGQWMLLDPSHTLPQLGKPGDPGTILNLFVVVVLLWRTVKIPDLVGRYLNQSRGGPNFLGQVVKVVVVQQGMKLIGLKGGGGKGKS